MKKLLLLKIGGGVVTDKSVRYGLREEVLERLAREIGQGWQAAGEGSLVIGNGAGSFAHYSAAKYRTMEGLVHEESRLGMGWVRYDAVKLNQLVSEQLLRAKVPVFSLSPSSLMLAQNGQKKELWGRVVEELLRQKMVPLVYGDVLVDIERGCTIFSTERVFEELIGVLAERYVMRVVHISAEEGVCRKGKASIFEKITQENWEEVRAHLGGSGGVDVTGGMYHKVVECLRLAKKGVKSAIVSGLVAGRVRAAVEGQEIRGTKIE